MMKKEQSLIEVNLQLKNSLSEISELISEHFHKQLMEKRLLVNKFTADDAKTLKIDIDQDTKLTLTFQATYCDLSGEEEIRMLPQDSKERQNISLRIATKVTSDIRGHARKTCLS